MLKRWFCLALACVMLIASLACAEEIGAAGDAIILETAGDGPIIEELPEDLDIALPENLELNLSDEGALDGGIGRELIPDGEIIIDNAEAGNDGEEGEPKLTLSAGKLTIGVKEKCTILKATRVPADAADTVTWSSNKTSVAKVDKKTGKITGVKKGSATITAKTASGLVARCAVTVKDAPGKVALTPTELTLSVGETYGLVAKLPSKTGSTLTYSSRDKKVATVGKLTGVVTAVAPGSTTITVKTFNGKTATCKLTVAAEPNEVYLPETLTLAVNDRATVEAYAVGADGARVPATFKYSAKQGTGKVSVNAKTGKVVGKAEGTAEIYVSAHNGVSTHLSNGERVETVCQVNVVEAPDRIELASGEITIGVGQTFDLKPKVLAADGAVIEAATYTVASSSEDDLSVSGEGVVKGLHPGSCTVTVTAFNGVQASCNVTVVKAPSKVTLAPDAVSLIAGTQTRLNVSLPSGTMASWTFSSSAPGVATVDGEGNVAAVAPGTAVICVETHNGKRAECNVTVVEASSGLIVTPVSVTGHLKEGGVQLTWRFDSAEEAAVTFESADPAIAGVSETGYVHFVGAGVTQVTAKAENGLTATVSIEVLADEAEPETAYRFFAAYSYYDSLPFVKRNSEGMAKVFQRSDIDGQGYAAKVLGNPSKANILSGISGFFADADDDDVSIVYLCSHGHNNKSSYSDYRLSLTGYDSNKNNPRYYLTSDEIFDSVQEIAGNVILILDSCYSGTFINDMKGKLKAENGRIAVLTAASNTKATFYNNKANAVDFFTFFLLQGLGYNEKEDWWNKNAAGDKGGYPGYFSADITGNNDGAATLLEFYSFASNCIDVNIPKYMKKSWYWGEKDKAQKTRIYAGNLKNLVIYRPE